MRLKHNEYAGGYWKVLIQRMYSIGKKRFNMCNVTGVRNVLLS
jgi:hypothetical protein